MTTTITDVECISLTPDGRELRRQIHEDGRETFAAQPRNDNYWITARTPRAAMIKAGWPRRMVDDVFGGDWRAW